LKIVSLANGLRREFHLIVYVLVRKA